MNLVQSNKNNYDLKVKPCVGCGFCCIQAKCAAGARLYGTSTICNALKWSNELNRYFCDLMLIPGALGENYRKELYAGEGCCSNLNSWRQNVIRRDLKAEEKVENNLDPLFQIFLNCLSKEFIGGDLLSLVIYRVEDELKKRNIPEDKIKESLKLILYHIKNNRSKFVEQFMG